jgi:hypothetical protein
MTRLQAIKEKLKQQKQHIEDLDKHMSVPSHYTSALADTDIYAATTSSRSPRRLARASRSKFSALKQEKRIYSARVDI